MSAIQRREALGEQDLVDPTDEERALADGHVKAKRERDDAVVVWVESDEDMFIAVQRFTGGRAQEEAEQYREGLARVIAEILADHRATAVAAERERIATLLRTKAAIVREEEFFGPREGAEVLRTLADDIQRGEPSAPHATTDLDRAAAWRAAYKAAEARRLAEGVVDDAFYANLVAAHEAAEREAMRLDPGPHPPAIEVHRG